MTHQGVNMSLSAPTKPVFLIAFALIILGIVATFTPIPQVSPNAFWIVAGGGILMSLGCLLKGL